MKRLIVRRQLRLKLIAATLLGAIQTTAFVCLLLGSAAYFPFAQANPLIGQNVLEFVAEYLLGETIDEVWDSATGKSDIFALGQRLQQLEAVLENSARPITWLREQIDFTTTKEEYETLTYAAIYKLQMDINDNNGRVHELERRIATFESEQQSAPREDKWHKYDLRSFVHRYIKASNRRSVSDALENYADRVDYFGKGEVGKDFIYKDKEYYFKRWREIHFEIDGDIGIQDAQNGRKRLTFSVLFVVANQARNSRISGTAYIVLEVRKIGNNIKIVDEKSEVIDRTTSSYF